jgi:tRNA threonylcarbamoyladenosine biosynthesis protein TsaB
MTLYLGIDTATTFLCLSLWSPENGTFACRSPNLGRSHASRIMTELDELFAKANLEVKALTGIGIGIGPGSYTGLRVGLATAQGIARGLDIPLAGCDTLAALAAPRLREGEKAFAALDAHRGNVYAGHYQKSEGGITTLQKPTKISRAELARARTGHRIISSGPPDATHIASSVSAGLPAEPVYL